MEASQKDWLGGRQFDVGRYPHGATLEETVATGVCCLVTGKRRDSNVYFVQSGETWVLVDTARMWDVTVYVHPGELPLPPAGRIIGALAGVERRWMFPSGQEG